MEIKHAVVFGAGSTIAQSVIDKLCLSVTKLFLFARNIDDLNIQIKDIKVKYPTIEVEGDIYDAKIDINERLTAKIDKVFISLGNIDLVLIAHGLLPNQEECVTNWGKAHDAIQVNGLSVIEICHNVALRLKQQQSGVITVISSVAGLRGRQSNYIYGTAKGMLNIYLQGLRNELYPNNVRVITVMPGFVDTKMTAQFDKKGLLWAKPEKIATDILNAVYGKKDIVYTPWFWRYIMLIITSIPEFKFKKLKL